MSGRARSALRLFATGVLLCADRGEGVAKEAVEHVKCEVCEIAMEEASKYAKENSLRVEDELSDMIEGLCSAKNPEGKWVTKLDIVREDDDAKLTIDQKRGVGVCKKECMIVQRACQGALEGKDEVILSLLQGARSSREMKKKVCKKICAKAVPKLKQWKDEDFEARSQTDLETEDMLAKLNLETGMGLEKYTKDDLDSMSEGDKEIMAAAEARKAERDAQKEL